MAGIPIHEIPNAAAPAAAPETPLATPSGATLIAPPNEPAAPPMDPAVHRVIQHWQETKANAGNAIASVNADTERSKFLETLRPHLESLAPDQRAPFVASQLPELRKTLAAFSMTPERASVETARQQQWETQTLGQITVQGTKEFFDQGRQLGIMDFHSKLKDGDIDGAFTRLADLRINHLLSEDEFNQETELGHAEVHEQGLFSAMQQNPKAFNRDITELHHTGSNAILGTALSDPENIAIWKQRSDTQLGKLRVGEQENLFTSIHGGTITRPDQLHAMYDGSQALGEDDLHAAKQALAKTSAPLDPINYNNLRVAVAQYDPQADPDSAKQSALQRTIASSLPSTESGKLNEQLKTLADKRPPTANVDAATKANLQQLFHHGLMGSPDQPQSAWKLGQHIDLWEAYQQANPDTSYEDASRWIHQQLKPDVLRKAGARPDALPVGANSPFVAWDETAGPSDDTNPPNQHPGPIQRTMQIIGHVFGARDPVKAPDDQVAPEASSTNAGGPQTTSLSYGGKTYETYRYAGGMKGLIGTVGGKDDFFGECAAGAQEISGAPDTKFWLDNKQTPTLRELVENNVKIPPGTVFATFSGEKGKYSNQPLSAGSGFDHTAMFVSSKTEKGKGGKLVTKVTIASQWVKSKDPVTHKKQSDGFQFQTLDLDQLVGGEKQTPYRLVTNKAD